MAVCIPFSSDRVVSLKYWIVAFTHWWVFYHGLSIVLPDGVNDFLSLLKKYALSFTLIIVYAWTVHAQYDFRIDASVLVARPFYFDHAMYSAVLLLLVALVFWSTIKEKESSTTKWLHLGWTGIMLTGVYFSYSRAAWLSALLASGLVLLVYLFSLQFKHLILLSMLILFGAMAMKPLISEKLSNNQAESKTDSLWEQLLSTANTTTDVSNLERLNRYSCAIRMTRDRPWTGFGPGMFQFAYLSYQRPEEMTRISVTSPGEHQAGKGGGAHSEYLQAFAEMGIIGGILWIGIVISMLWTLLYCYHLNPQTILLALLFGLTTFFIHALFNNFLHHAKVSVLVWGSLAILNVIYLNTLSSSNPRS
jgi:O-antigen ligase